MCGGGHLVDGGGNLIGFLPLLLHRLFGALRLRRYLGHPGGEVRGNVANLPHQRMNGIEEVIERIGQLADFIPAGER
ncbi:hypothetical protein D3C85_1831600 [compost metagenome]